MKILIVNLMQIGDLVLTTPIFHSLRQRFPNAFLAAAVNQNFADLVKFNPYLNQLFDINKRSWSDFFKSLKLIRATNFDLVINLNRSERACALAAFSKGKRIIGYAKPIFHPFFDDVLPNLKRQIHQLDSHFRVLEHVGFNNLDNFGLEVFVPDSVQENMQAFFLQHFPPNVKIVAFNVGASWSSKRWLPNYFAQVANQLIQRGFHIAFLGSNSDLPIVNQCTNLISNSNLLHVFTGQFSLLELAAFFDYCNLLISNDSGPMHIAAARNLPAVSIFGSSPTIGFSPLLHSHFLIKSPAPCHPCYLHNCPNSPDSYMLCMKSITPDIVLKYSLELLSTFDKPAKDLPRIHGAYDCKIIDIA